MSKEQHSELEASALGPLSKSDKPSRKKPLPTTAHLGKRSPDEQFRRRVSRSAWWVNSVGLAVVLVFLVGSGFWAANTEVSGAVVASGELTSKSGRKTIEHFKGGVVSRIHVNNGDTVEEGALLIKLDNVSVLSEIEIVESELDVLLPRLARLEAETKGLNTVAVDEMLRARAKERPSAADGLADEIALFVTREEALRQEADWLNEKVGMLRTQLRGLEPQIVSLDKRLASLAGESSIQRKLLKKGLTTLNALTALERRYEEVLGDKSRLISERASISREINQIGISKLQSVTEFRRDALQEMNDLQTKIASLHERRIAAQNELRLTEIRAPEDGIVLDMEVKSIGGAIRPGEPLMYIVPTRDDFVVSARVELNARDKIRYSQTANIVFPGLDAAKTPPSTGTVLRIGADALEDERTGERYYEVDIEVTGKDIELIEKAIETRLVVGMPVEAFLTTESRTVADHLLQPLLKNMRRIFQET